MNADPFGHNQIDVNGISVHTVSVGQGPLVVFCHGFPECWYSWRHQLPAVAAAGFRAVALDMRGYGGTTAPEATGAYTLSHTVGDVVGVVAALGESRAVVVGHDLGAPVAWYSALMRPDVFRAVVGMSVPYVAPAVLPAVLPGTGVFDRGWDGYFPLGQDFVQQLVVPKTLPAWLTEDDVEFYAAELARSGFHGGLSWFRNINSQPAILAPFVGAALAQPSLYFGGENDRIAANPAALQQFPTSLPSLRAVHILPGAGHWIQQERPVEVNDALVAFLVSL
jgi:pimeloyl-ACP methyl ester carboxylesterase